MKIFDCFMYFDEEQVLDLRLNVLDEYVDNFVIVESIYNHKGEKRDLLFNKKKFRQFNDKIIYLTHNKVPKLVETINVSDDKKEKDRKYTINAIYRENEQRNFISEGLINADENDLILISDVDEIPKLSSINLKNINDEIIFFKQDMFYYKYNLTLPNFKWTGTKAVKKKKLISPQWLRNVKDKKYSFYRIDTLISDTKYMNVKIIEDGGWHFSNIKSPKLIEHKLKSYLHHREFDQVSMSINEIENLVKRKQAIYNLSVDKKNTKFGNGEFLEKFEIDKLPEYIKNNYAKYQDWID